MRIPRRLVGSVVTLSGCMLVSQFCFAAEDVKDAKEIVGAKDTKAVKEFKGPSMFAPQICGGRTFSTTAKRSGWLVDTDAKACRVTVGNRPLLAHVSAREFGSFSVMSRLRFGQGARMRLVLDDLTIELSNKGRAVEVVGGPKTIQRSDIPAAKSGDWTMLMVVRTKGNLKVKLNEVLVAEFPDKGRPYKNIGLEPAGGDIDVNHFFVNGHLIVRADAKAESVPLKD